MNGEKSDRKGSKDRDIKAAIQKTLKSFGSSLPMIFGIILLVGLFKTFVTSEMISSVFTGNLLSDTLLGAGIGSISAGSPITSYIIGGELLKEKVSLFAITAFIVAWVSVGIVQLPAEAKMLGKCFAIVRNVLSFIFAILIAIATVITMEAIG